MAKTKKPVQKKTPAKKSAYVAEKVVVTKPTTKTKPVKPAAKKATAKPAKKSTTKPMAKMVVDRMPLPKGGKLFVKAAKRPTAKKAAKKPVKKTAKKAK